MVDSCTRNIPYSTTNLTYIIVVILWISSILSM
jgi:hypothetical protein